jgi:DNA-binding NtrC family response regulator
LEDAWTLLRTYPWPGNIQELENCLKRVLTFGRGHAIREEDIRRALQPEFENVTLAVATARSADLLAGLVEGFLSAHAGPHAYARFVEETERTLLMEALRRVHGNQTRAAAILGIPRPTLHAKLQKYQINLESALTAPPKPQPGRS